VIEGDACDVLKFPVPRHHEEDKARFIGTADCVITQDPDAGWFNLGAFRSQVYDGRTIGCQITEGKHGRIHRDKYFARGQPMKVVILCGQDPLLFMLAGIPVPEISELDIAGGIRGEPIDVIRGPYTGFPIPADCEIAIEGETVPGQVRPEGPFGEWMGYYSDDTQPRPYVNVKTILYRNDPILCCAPQHKPVDETGLLKGIGGAAEIWRSLEACGIPDVLGVWNHEGAPATRFTVIQIRQRYPGHARNALHVASNCLGGAYAGKWTVVGDEDIDAGDLDQVLCFPSKPVRLLVPFPAGGPTDIIGRLAAEGLTQAWNVQVVVDNRPGGAGNIGMEQCAKSPADGYTMCVISIAQSISPAIYPELGFDPVADFSHVALLVTLPSLLVVHPSVPAKNVKELIAYAKARPGKLNYASGGSGTSSHLLMEM